MRIRTGQISVFVALLALLVSPAAAAAAVIGQVSAPVVEIDGLPSPSGTTLLGGSTVKTAGHPAVVHLRTGQAVELARNSAAEFKETENGEVEALVTSGLLSYRSTSGQVSTIAAGSTLVATGTGVEAIGASVPGLVAILVQEALEGSVRLKVNDTARINPEFPVLVLKQDEEIGEVHYVQNLKTDEVVTTTGLKNAYEPNSYLIQGDEVLAAVAAGKAVVVGAAVGGVGKGAFIAGVSAGSATGIGIVTGLTDRTVTGSSSTPEQ